ncbi:hypothetical protein [Photobacterium damselae]|uniref:hypothetical protein n=1 Tax=Photobacterium damselae TaxID=38293 RepID=UPI002542E9A3
MAVSFLLFFLLIYINKKEFAFGYLFSVLEFDSFVAAQNVIIYALFFCVILNLVKEEKVKSNKSTIFVIFVFVLFIYWCILSWGYYIGFTYNINYIDYAFTTLKHFLVVFLVFIILLNEFKLENTCTSIHAMIASSILFIIYSIIFNLPSLKMDGMGVGYSSQIFFFFIYLSSYLLFFKVSFIKKIICLLILILLAYISKLTNTLSSQNILSILMLIPFLSLLNFRKIILVSVVALIVYNIISIDLLYGFVGDSLKIKVDNIYNSMLNINNIYLIPHSVQVRVIELQNIFSELNIIELLFGKGVGGYFTDVTYPFVFLNGFDFSSAEIANRVFFQPHNFSNLILKIGLMFPFVLFIKIKCIKSKWLYVYISVYLFSMMNFGFTYFPSVLLGMLLAGIINNENKKSLY